MTDQELQEHCVTHNKTNSWWLKDARNIELCRICDDCYEVKRSQYRPEVLGDYGNYEDIVEETIEEDW